MQRSQETITLVIQPLTSVTFKTSLSVSLKYFYHIGKLKINSSRDILLRNKPSTF